VTMPSAGQTFPMGLAVACILASTAALALGSSAAKVQASRGPVGGSDFVETLKQQGSRDRSAWLGWYRNDESRLSHSLEEVIETLGATPQAPRRFQARALRQFFSAAVVIHQGVRFIYDDSEGPSISFVQDGQGRRCAILFGLLNEHVYKVTAAASLRQVRDGAIDRLGPLFAALAGWSGVEGSELARATCYGLSEVHGVRYYLRDPIRSLDAEAVTVLVSASDAVDLAAGRTTARAVAGRASAFAWGPGSSAGVTGLRH
jgi:hypothetical protein